MLVAVLCCCERTRRRRWFSECRTHAERQPMRRALLTASRIRRSAGGPSGASRVASRLCRAVYPRDRLTQASQRWWFGWWRREAPSRLVRVVYQSRQQTRLVFYCSHCLIRYSITTANRQHAPECKCHVALRLSGLVMADFVWGWGELMSETDWVRRQFAGSPFLPSFDFSKPV